MRDTKNINIVGGGIAGMATALTLQTLDIPYKLFEKQPEITYDNVGLGISANVFPILEKWSVLKATQEIGSQIKNFHFVDQKLHYIKSFQLAHPPLSVNRRLFYQILNERLDKASTYLNSPKLAESFTTDDIVIAAEGINSLTRQTVYPELKLRNSHQVLWRGICQISLEEKFQNSYHDFIGNNLRFAIIHTGKDYYSWYIIKEKATNEVTLPDKAYLKTLFEDYSPIVNNIIEQTQDIYFTEMRDINPKKRKGFSWFKNNLLMIGDTIHPTTPNMANGACLAIEDGYLLANLLHTSNLSVQEIFGQFQQQRIKKTDPIIFQSWWLGKLLHQKSTIIDCCMKTAIAITPQFLFNKTYSAILKEK